MAAAAQVEEGAAVSRVAVATAVAPLAAVVVGVAEVEVGKAVATRAASV